LDLSGSGNALLDGTHHMVNDWGFKRGFPLMLVGNSKVLQWIVSRYRPSRKTFFRFAEQSSYSRLENPLTPK
jgi:hypothetical protein